MGAQEYGALCKHRAEELGISQNLLASRLMRAFTLDEGEERTFDATAVRLIYQGGRKIDAKLFRQLNEILGIAQDEAEYALGVWPSDLDLASYRRFRHLASAQSMKHSRGTRRIPAELAPVIALPVPPGLDEQIDGLRPRDQWRWADRRKHDRRGWRRVLEPAA